VDDLEIRGLVKLLRSLGSGPLKDSPLWVQASLFADFDTFFKKWNPEEDALRIAADLVSELDGTVGIEEILAFGSRIEAACYGPLAQWLNVYGVDEFCSGPGLT
jgi:hypothetical protein